MAVAGAAGVSPVSLLDPRFKYVPADATDITATWRRHGFDAGRNAERRERLQQRSASPDISSAAIHPLVRRSA
jgi:hypothetical protein